MVIKMRKTKKGKGQSRLYSQWLKIQDRMLLKEMQMKNNVHYTCVCDPGCQCVNCVEVRDGISQLKGQAENEGDRRTHRGDMHTKRIWTNTTLIMASMLGVDYKYDCTTIAVTSIHLSVYYFYVYLHGW